MVAVVGVAIVSVLPSLESWSVNSVEKAASGGVIGVELMLLM